MLLSLGNFKAITIDNISSLQFTKSAVTIVRGSSVMFKIFKSSRKFVQYSQSFSYGDDEIFERSECFVLTCSKPSTDEMLFPKNHV